MQDNKTILKIIIPVVAVVVIIESLILVKDLKAKKVAMGQKAPAGQVKQKENPVYELDFITDESVMKVGKSYFVELVLNAKETKMVDSLSSYIKYDKTAFDISELTYDSTLPKANFSKVSSDNGLIVNTVLIAEPKGLEIASGNKLILARFKVKPKTVGDYSFEVDTGNLTKESVTMIIENATAKVLPFVSNKLKVSVTAQ